MGFQLLPRAVSAPLTARNTNIDRHGWSIFVPSEGETGTGSLPDRFILGSMVVGGWRGGGRSNRRIGRGSSVVINKQQRLGEAPKQFVLSLLTRSSSVALLLLLVGCTFAEPYEHFAVLDQEPTLEDSLPAEVVKDQLHGFDVDSLRFGAEYEGDRVYLAKGDEPNGGICVLIVGPDVQSISTACSGGSWVGIEGPGSHLYHIHSDASPSPLDGYTDLTDNISVMTG